MCIDTNSKHEIHAPEVKRDMMASQKNTPTSSRGGTCSLRTSVGNT